LPALWDPWQDGVRSSSATEMALKEKFIRN
jgi:hypothetical protein